MAELLIYPQSELPERYACQILSFLRVVWWQGFVGENRLRDWITHERFHPVSYLLVESGLVISHAQVVWKVLAHGGEAYLAYGLTGVFTYPAFRGQGYGAQVVRAATQAIDAGPADVALFNCAPELAAFYGPLGWTPQPDMQTLIGDRDHPVAANELLMMRFLSEKGRRDRAAFEHGALFFDEDDTW